MKSGKCWGETICLFKNDNFEVHYLGIDGDSYCSKHKHIYKYNLFYVIEGQLKVKVWQKDYDLCDITVLNVGDTMTVKPGLYHQFFKDDKAYCRALEIYYPQPIGDDIVRESVGGKG